MTPATGVDIDALLNDLYWSSTRTIDQIVDEFGVGKATLYGRIRPLSAGAPCPECSGNLLFTNRTHRSSHTGVCDACGTTIRIIEELPVTDSATLDANGHGEKSRWLRPERAAFIGGAAALGLALGAATARAIRH
jgi:hypothetical protein